MHSVTFEMVSLDTIILVGRNDNTIQLTGCIKIKATRANSLNSEEALPTDQSSPLYDISLFVFI